MRAVQCLVVAKAPVPGLAKTRLAADLGAAVAADLAAASLLDTLDACRSAFPVEQCRLALAGDLDHATRGSEIRAALAGWRVFPQCGHSLAERLAAAHADVAGAPVVQIGMDTPQVTRSHLTDASASLRGHDAVLGVADDGGWWVLGLRDPRHAHVLSGVAMSRPTTGAATIAALRGVGLGVGRAVGLRDVDRIQDCAPVAAAAPAGRFAAAWRRAAAPTVTP